MPFNPPEIELKSDSDMKGGRYRSPTDVKLIAELEARIERIVAGAILPADAVDEFTVDGVRWVRVPAEATVTFSRSNE